MPELPASNRIGRPGQRSGPHYSMGVQTRQSAGNGVPPGSGKVLTSAAKILLSLSDPQQGYPDLDARERAQESCFLACQRFGDTAELTCCSHVPSSSASTTSTTSGSRTTARAVGRSGRLHFEERSNRTIARRQFAVARCSRNETNGVDYIRQNICELRPLSTAKLALSTPRMALKARPHWACRKRSLEGMPVPAVGRE